MSVQIQINKQTKELQLVVDKTIVKTLTQQEANDFLLHAKEEAEENGYLFKPGWFQISESDVEKYGCPIDELKGIDVSIVIYYRCFPECHVQIAFVDTKGETHYGPSLNDNFTPEQIHFGSVTNHQLRACFEDELVERMMDIRGFTFNLGSPYGLFDETKTHYYDAEESSDT